MRIEKDGGPAFPAWELNGHGRQEMTCFGMSLRDYFAAKAMAAIIPEATGKDWEHDAATAAYIVADAMLEARQK